MNIASFKVEQRVCKVVYFFLGHQVVQDKSQKLIAVASQDER